jgi:hypothetical protein
MAGKKLTDRALKALKPKGRRYDVRDPETPGLVVRVSLTGSRSFTLQARFPGSGGVAAAPGQARAGKRRRSHHGRR